MGGILSIASFYIPALGTICGWGDGRPKSNDERVVIVGASSGIGKATALKYARRGSRLVLCARRKTELEAVAEECRAYAKQHQQEPNSAIDLSTWISVVTVDVTSLADVRKLARHVRHNPYFRGTIDTVVLCSGAISVLPYAQLAHLDEATARWNAECDLDDETEDGGDTEPSLAGSVAADTAYQKVMDVNVFGLVRCARELFPGVAAAKGNIIVVSSVSGKVGVPTRSLYSSSKHALHGFFDSFRIEVARHGVHVGLVCPSTVSTDLRSAAIDVPPLSTGASGSVVHGSQRGKETPEGCADIIIWSSDTRQRETYVPLAYTMLPVLRHLLPTFFDRITSARYGY